MLAQRVGRGARSALGIHGFARGGFLIDGGKSRPDVVGTLAARADFPADWRMLLVTPESRPGLAGSAEIDAFGKLPGMSGATCDHLCRIVLAELLPAVLEADFKACGEALYEFGENVGEYFAPVQGGVYADAEMAELVAHLRQRGVRGVGQTSWGPTIFALCSNANEAAALVHDLAECGRWNDCRMCLAAPLNTGAAIEFGLSSHDAARLAERGQ
jgi:beta-RFAP synthase